MGLDASVKALAAFSAAAKSFFEDFKVALATIALEGPIGYFISDFWDAGFKTAVFPAVTATAATPFPDFKGADADGSDAVFAALPELEDFLAWVLFEDDAGTDGLLLLSCGAGRAAAGFAGVLPAEALGVPRSNFFSEPRREDGAAEAFAEPLDLAADEAAEVLVGAAFGRAGSERPLDLAMVLRFPLKFRRDTASACHA